MTVTGLDSVTRIQQEAAGIDHELVSATPRGDDHLLVTLREVDGFDVVGQWFADAERCASTADETEALAAPGTVRRLGRHLLVQSHGADRRIPTLHRLALAEGARLLAHRPERRGVVVHERDGRRHYTKVVRPGQLDAVVATLQAVAGTSSLRVPRVIDADPATGTVTLSELPGPTLRHLLGDPRRDVADAAGAGAAVGHAARLLHETPVPDGRPTHAAADELALTRQWLAHAVAHGLLPASAPRVERLQERARHLLAGTPGRTALLHRDLHDKQLLVGDRGGVLDLDLAAAGDPALDLANLLVHLELRARQGAVSWSRARACADGVLRAYAPDEALRAHVRGYGVATRLRLLGVYAFRPHSSAAARRLVTDPLLEETS